MMEFLHEFMREWMNTWMYEVGHAFWLSLTNWLHMSGYAAYVWSAYGLVTVGVLGMQVVLWRWERRMVQAETRQVR